MRTRMIFVSTAQRRLEISKRFKIPPNDMEMGAYLFHLQFSTVDEAKAFFRDFSHLSPFFNFLLSAPSEQLIKIIPYNVLFKELKSINVEGEGQAFIAEVVNYFTSPKRKWRKFKHIFPNNNDLPKIMGILNVTPDSFSDGGKYLSKEKAVEHALKMEAEGADIIDIGGESTRPGAKEVKLDEELERVIPVIEEIRKHSTIPISIDSYKSVVAEQALKTGANIINDISGMIFDTEMKSVIERYACPVAIMHIKGRPGNMQNNPQYKDVTESVFNFLQNQYNVAKHLNDDKVIIDPGIGFGKTLQHNYKLIRDMVDFSFIDAPLLIGASRKSIIKKTLDVDASQSINGSVAVALLSIFKSANIVRVHDVLETKQAMKMVTAIENMEV